MQIPLIAKTVLMAIQSICPTLRFDIVGWPNAERVYGSGRRCIFSFWHRCSFSAAWWWRNQGVVVLNSTNFDGQWTRRMVESMGFGTAQGSSTRGGLRGLAVLAQRIEKGHDAAFTIDGPRGPRYVAKPGPVLLARRTGAPIVCFYIHPERAYTLEKTWDLFQIPKPFSRVALVVSPAIEVPGNADRDVIESKQHEMQLGLERARHTAESWFTLSEAERERQRILWASGDIDT